MARPLSGERRSVGGEDCNVLCCDSSHAILLSNALTYDEGYSFSGKSQFSFALAQFEQAGSWLSHCSCLQYLASGTPCCWVNGELYLLTSCLTPKTCNCYSRTLGRPRNDLHLSRISLPRSFVVTPGHSEDRKRRCQTFSWLPASAVHVLQDGSHRVDSRRDLQTLCANHIRRYGTWCVGQVRSQNPCYRMPSSVLSTPSETHLIGQSKLVFNAASGRAAKASLVEVLCRLSSAPC
jgi:hypothetical protein